MADEDKTVVQGGSPEGSEEAAPKKGMNKLVLFGGIGVGAVVIGIVLALFVIKPMMSSTEAEDESTEQVQQETKKDEPKKKKSGEKLVDEKGNEVESLLYAINDIVINPSGTGGSRFLSVSFGFEVESKELHEEFSHKEVVVRDALITIMSSKTVAELTDARQKEVMRYQIKKRLSKLLHTEDLAGVYYTDFVLQ
ncbi:MAG: hypothetical protein DWP97_04255 [Calditrichaeota bacterium]|nr:MAG: hypothetical protein DWP97_04255 [Calditrichota bacterium]